MIIGYIMLSLLASEPDFRTDATTILRNHNYQIRFDDQVCYGLYEYYRYGSSDILRKIPELPFEEWTRHKEQNLKSATYWLIEAAKLEAEQAQIYLERIIKNYNPEMLHESSFFHTLKSKLEEEYQKLSTTITEESNTPHSTQTSGDETYVDQGNSLSSHTNSEKILKNKKPFSSRQPPLVKKQTL